MATRAEILTLHRYFIWQDRMRAHFDELLAMRISGEETKPIEEFLYMSYWYGGLYVVVDGWRELELEDAQVDHLLESPNVELLRVYRNGVFHFQRTYYDNRFNRIIDEGEDIAVWVRALNDALGTFLLEQLQGDPAEEPSGDAGPVPTD